MYILASVIVTRLYADSSGSGLAMAYSKEKQRLRNIALIIATQRLGEKGKYRAVTGDK